MKKNIFFYMIMVVIFYLIIGIVRLDMTTVFACIVSLLLIFCIELLQKKIGYSDLCKFLCYVFVLSTEILGQIYHFYTRVWYFDIIMHTFSSFIISYLSYYLLRFFGDINKMLLLLFIFSFAMMIESVWEISEFCIDRVFNQDMQKDTIINEITSTYFSTSGDTPVKLKVNDVIVDGISFYSKYGGYIDIGLYDTISDMVCALVGSGIFIIIFKKRLVC